MSFELPTAIDEVSIDALRGYVLGAGGWFLDRVTDFGEVWTSGSSGRSWRVEVPTDTSLDDYTLRYKEALERIGSVFSWSVSRLSEEVVSNSSDILYLRADQFSRDGTVPIRQAEAMISGAVEMMTFAACSAVSPRNQFRGKRPNAAVNFIEDDLRMGHTRHGSFVITIVTRLDAEERRPVPALVSAGVAVSDDPTSNVDVPGSKSPAAAPAEEVVIPSFQRRVTRTLSTGLHSMRDLVSTHGTTTLEEAVAQGVSSNLVASIEKMTDLSGLRGVEMSFSWSPAQSLRPETSEPVRFDREVSASLPVVRERLERRPITPERESIAGQVVALERGADQDEGVSVISGVTGSNVRRNVRVTLRGDDYGAAIRAHENRSAVIATGELYKRGNAWWLRDPVTFTPSR